MTIRLWISKRDGSVRALHNAVLEKAIPVPIKEVTRVSHIEYNIDCNQWEVRLTSETEVLFRHRLREACVLWEQQNLIDHLLERMEEKDA